MNKQEFINKINKLNIKINLQQQQQLDSYYQLLVSYNEKVNLTSITKKEDVYLKHFYDSLTLVKGVDLTKNITLCDIGTGAGFPGIVLKICFPNLNITLVDSLEKRIKFLDLVIETLNLEKIKTVHSRIEDLNEYEKFDIVVSRAVAKTNILLELGCRLPKVEGLFILMKGKILDELKLSSNAIKKLNYSIEKVINFSLPIESSERNLLVLKKNAIPEKVYPRNFDKIKKRPL